MPCAGSVMHLLVCCGYRTGGKDAPPFCSHSLLERDMWMVSQGWHDGPWIVSHRICYNCNFRTLSLGESTSPICFHLKLVYKIICWDANKYYIFRLGDHAGLCRCLIFSPRIWIKAWEPRLLSCRLVIDQLEQPKLFNLDAEHCLNIALCYAGAQPENQPKRNWYSKVPFLRTGSVFLGKYYKMWD